MEKTIKQTGRHGKRRVKKGKKISRSQRGRYEKIFGRKGKKKK